MFEIKTVGLFCKYYRSVVLDLTLEEMSDKTGIKKTTLTSFENGRSSNLNHLGKYLEVSKTDEEIHFFRMKVPFKVGE